MIASVAAPSRVVVIAGATGLVGQHLLARLVRDRNVSRILVVGRRAPALQDPRIVPCLVDFAIGGTLQSRMQDAIAGASGGTVDDAYCCLGTTIKTAGSKPAFRAVDHDAVVAFATAARACGAQRFLLVSSLGADASSSNFYLRTKGEADDAVARLGYPLVVIARPSILDGPRTEKRPGEKVGLAFMRGLTRITGKTWRYAPIHVDTVAAALLHAANDPQRAHGVRIVESSELHALARDAVASG